MFRLLKASLIPVMATSFLAGQPIVESLDFERPESWAMRYFAAASLMHGTAPPETLAQGQWALGFDVANIPRLSKSERTVGFNGTKQENMNKAPVIARPLLHYGLTDRFSLTAAYVPPVEIFDRLETHMAGLFLNYQWRMGERFRITTRLGGQWSEATGDFTCAEEIAGVMDPDINPYNCIEPSHDTFTSLTGTVELVADYRLKTKRPVDLFLSAAYTYADLEFDVDALWGGGVKDQRRLMTDGDIWSFGGGIKWALTENIHTSLMIIHVPLDVRRPPDFQVESSTLTHFRLSVSLLL